MSPVYRELTHDEITLLLFADFDRRQTVTQCWRRENEQWVLKDVPFVDDWNHEQKAFLVTCLQNTLAQNGVVLAALQNGTLLGFASVEGMPFGSHCQYLQLSSLHVSNPCRGLGIGKALFAAAASKARQLGGAKLYISAHSAKETQAFYRSLGCVDAQEINRQLYDAEPFDRQLEYPL